MNILVPDNASKVTEFILVGLSHHPKAQIAFYRTMVAVYLITLVEYFLHVVMAYDRFIAISNPLHYPIIMKNQVFLHLAMVNWAIPVEAHLLRNPSQTFLGLVISIFTLALPFTFIFISYTHIVVAMLRIHSAEVRRKAFSICGSHLTVITIFCGTAIHMYLKPYSKAYQDQGKVISAYYGVVTPRLNPLIYTLRKKDVKDVLRKIIRKKES
ncbi:Olfactory receptor 13H1 [Camelus dromedarius]|uniref:Olfactory receptor 13H1 n=1 Tax=Camelus dromedarius TaxID=9838 RepID=A0A5N4C2M6_CAMDR|nr:Olfactory receptor 13H1 [Camelus dromedarius]